MKSKNQTKKTIIGRISDFIITVIVIGLMYSLLVVGIKIEKENKEPYTKSFIDSVMIKNEKNRISRKR